MNTFDNFLTAEGLEVTVRIGVSTSNSRTSGKPRDKLKENFLKDRQLGCVV